MGRFYKVKCKHCGYSYTARYGGGRKDNDTIILKRKFEEGKAEKGLQYVYDALRNTVTEREDKDNQEFVLQNTYLTEEDLQDELLFFKSPWISDPWWVYACFKCKKFFEHKRVIMTCDKGVFEEQYVECPECRDPLAVPVDKDDFRPKDPKSFDTFICDVQCPACLEDLTVLSWGFWD